MTKLSAVRTAEPYPFTKNLHPFDSRSRYPAVNGLYVHKPLFSSLQTAYPLRLSVYVHVLHASSCNIDVCWLSVERINPHLELDISFVNIKDLREIFLNLSWIVAIAYLNGCCVQFNFNWISIPSHKSSCSFKRVKINWIEFFHFVKLFECHFLKEFFLREWRPS